MVQFTPRPIKENVNISKISPKREFLVLFCGLIGILVVCYFCLGVTLNFLIDKMPSTVIYSPSVYGIDNRCTGKGVKIAILDSGCTNHKDIKFEGDKISFCEDNVIVNM